MQITVVPTPQYTLSVDDKELRTLRDGLRLLTKNLDTPDKPLKFGTKMLPDMEQMGLGEW